ncbi:CHASE2 domain-containing sensor protein [Bradyrhizobium sp. LM6.10]
MPLSAACIGSAPVVMATVLSLGALALGVLANRVRSRGRNMEVLFAAVAALFFGAEIVLILHPPWPSLLPWCVVSVAGSATALTYAIIGDYFPPQLVARANGGLNVLQFGWAFIVQ